MEAEKSGLPPWMVLDVRLAREGVHSGMSRFVVGFSRALAEELRECRKSGNVPADLRLMFASKYEPAAWIVDLVRQYPDVTSFWSGGKGALTGRWNKPAHWWATGAVKRLKRYTRGEVLWIAPGNCDRPDMVGGLFGKKNFSRVVQVIHDAIPFEHPKSFGFFAGMRHRMRVKSTLNRFPLVLTVSESSSQALKKISKSKNLDIRVLGEGVDGLFGANQKPVDASERKFLRREFLISAGFASAGDAEQDFADRKWVLGVGGNQPHKCWGDAEKAVASVRRDVACLFVRVDGDSETAKEFAERGAERMGSCWFLKDKGVLLVPTVSDEVLSLAYRVSDVLLHPSVADGFGLSCLEAALSGLPVLFRKGSAVESHFSDGRLPECFWRGIDGTHESEWGAALSEMLGANTKRDKFFEAMSKSVSPRDFVLKSAGLEGAFEWRASACAFLEALRAHHKFEA